ncbi:MAG: hypothetical protein ACJ8AI_10350 [Rhodopila sp.]
MLANRRGRGNVGWWQGRFHCVMAVPELRYISAHAAMPKDREFVYGAARGHRWRLRAIVTTMTRSVGN